MESLSAVIAEYSRRLRAGEIKMLPDDPSCPLDKCDGKGLLFVDDDGPNHEWAGYDPRVRECPCIEYRIRMERLTCFESKIGWRARMALMQPERYNPAHPAIKTSDRCFRQFQLIKDPTKLAFLLSGPTGSGKTTAAWRTIGAMSRTSKTTRDYTKIAWWPSLGELWAIYKYQRRDEWPAVEKKFKWCSIAFVDEVEISDSTPNEAKTSINDMMKWILDTMDECGFYLFMCTNLDADRFVKVFEDRVKRRIFESLIMGGFTTFADSVTPIMKARVVTQERMFGDE